MIEAGEALRDGDPARGTAALQKGIGLLEALSEAGGAASFSEIVRASGLPKATVHRILAALLERGLIRFERRDDRYRFGWKLIEFARFAQADLDLPTLIEPELIRLQSQTGETVFVALPHGPDVVCSKVLETSAPGGIALSEGSTLPGHCTAAGKAILAFADRTLRPAMLDRLKLAPRTPRSLTELSLLDAQLDIAKARRYAIEDEEFETGQRSVAAPILDHGGRAIGAIAVVAPAFRLTTERLHELGADLLKAAARITGQAAFSQPETRRSAMMATRARCVVETQAFLGEGPVWNAAEARLEWVDILAPALHNSDPAKGTDRVVEFDELVGAFAPCSRGGLVIAAQSGFALFDPETRKTTPLIDPEADKPNNRFNDGKCDSRGRFWAGTMDMGVAPGAGSLYRLDRDGTAHCMERGIGIANGLGWSPDDRRMYFTDTLARTIFVYDFDAESGTIANRRVFAQTLDHMGVPDGLTVDAEGFVWSAQWDGWQLIRFDPDGRIDQTVSLPVPRPTSCTFGGPGAETLYVTSARIRLSAQQLTEAPLSGSIFAIDGCGRGLAEGIYRFDGP
jgi:sugar lactone lactonase YvrE/DNA-binding IclR family transcriptional regulator